LQADQIVQVEQAAFVTRTNGFQDCNPDFKSFQPRTRTREVRDCVLARLSSVSLTDSHWQHSCAIATKSCCLVLRSTTVSSNQIQTTDETNDGCETAEGLQGLTSCVKTAERERSNDLEIETENSVEITTLHQYRTRLGDHFHR